MDDKYFKMKVAGVTIVSRFTGDLWEKIKNTQEDRKIGTVAEFIKLELYDEFQIYPADEGKLLKEIKKSAPYPNPKRTRKKVPEKMLSTAIINALKDRHLNLY